jgi:hypothetical protein
MAAASHAPRAPRRRKALCVGINYYGTPAQLGGCVNDVKLMSATLHRLGFTQIETLTDEPGRAFSGAGMPTRANIEAACRRLVQGAQEGDSLFFHYSGHGGRSVNLSGRERTGYDSTLIPVDHNGGKNQIIDDDMDALLTEPARAAGARLTCVVDACHSGTVLDLPFLCRGADAAGNWLWVTEDATSLAVTERTGSVRAMMCAVCLAPRNTFAKPPEDAVGGLVTCLSGSSDAQTSADTKLLSGTSEATGACTWCFVEAIGQGASSWSEVMGFIRHKLKQTKFRQVPQFCANRRFALDEPLNI